jgi:transposase, IS30 family
VRHFWLVIYQQLSTEERYSIAAMRASRHSALEIARELKRHPSTIYREVERNRAKYDGAYRPFFAVEKCNGRRRRSRRNRHYTGDHFAVVERLLREDLSPQQITGRLRLEGVRVMSHETIYLHIWADKAHGGTLWRHLRGARKLKRKRYGRYDSRGRLAGKKMIEQRPAVVGRRSRLGDWEIDTVHGRGKPAAVTIVERKSGVVRLGPLARATVACTNARTIGLLSCEQHRVRTLTSDNGAEFHGYKDIERALHTRVYFATPHHAWERGTNENTNGLLRQYLPKRTCLKHLTQKQCHVIAERLNNRPRLRLGFRTPNEVYYGLPIARRPWVAPSGKLFGSCPRERPKAFPSGRRAYLKRRSNPLTVALQT